MTYLLVAIGVVMIYSSSAILAHEKYHNAEYFLCRQIFLLLGTVGFFVAASLPVKFYKNNARV